MPPSPPHTPPPPPPPPPPPTHTHTHTHTLFCCPCLQVDQDHSGVIDFEEWAAAMADWRSVGWGWGRGLVSGRHAALPLCALLLLPLLLQRGARLGPLGRHASTFASHSRC